MLRKLNGDSFTTGRAGYDARVLDGAPRIVIQIQIEGHAVEASVDTGGLWVVIQRDLAELIGVGGSSTTEIIGYRGHKIKGRVDRVALELLAEDGNSILLEASALVPDAHSAPYVDRTILGFQGCLDRFRFAIDPVHQDFHFGTIDDEA